MLTEIIIVLTKSYENMMIPTEHVLTLAKRIEAQRAQAAAISSLHEVENFDAMLQKDEGKQKLTKLVTPVKQPVRRRCKYYSQVHKLRQCPASGKRCENCKNINHFLEVCRSSKALKASSNKAVITVPYKVDMGSDRNIMPFYIYKKVFPMAKMEQLAATKHTKIKLKCITTHTITKLGTCKVN